MRLIELLLILSIAFGTRMGSSKFLKFAGDPAIFNIDFFFFPRFMHKVCGLHCYPPVFGQYFLASNWCSIYDACFLLAGGFVNLTPTSGIIPGL